MFNAWWLLVIIPASAFAGSALFALIWANSEPDECNPEHCRYYGVDKDD